MAKVYDRVQETTITSGQGPIELAGAVNGFRSFASVVPHNEQVHYVITYGNMWEIGVGTYNINDNILTRDTVHSSTNNNKKVTFPQDAIKYVFIDSTAQAWTDLQDSSAGFGKVVVAGQSNILADEMSDELTFAAGSGISITTDPAIDTITITNKQATTTALGGVTLATNAEVMAGTNENKVVTPSTLAYFASNSNIVPGGGGGGSGTFARTESIVIAAAGQTSFAQVYSPGNIDVFVNGIRLLTTDFTATDGAFVVLADPCIAGQEVVFVKWTPVATPTIEAGTLTRTETNVTVAAAAGQQSFSISYTPNNLDVYINGMRLLPSDYTATDGLNVVLSSAAKQGQEVTFVAWKLVSAAGYMDDVAPGPSGNVLTSNGTAWTSSAPAAQVQADWNATSGVSSILNKPTIPAAQVQADWNATSGVSSILNKPTIPDSLTNGGSFQGIKVFNSSGTYTKPAGLKRIKVIVIGGGGGCGGFRTSSAESCARGGAGGGGGVCIDYIEASEITEPVIVTVGAGGAGGGSYPSNGGSGGVSSFGSFCSATGGAGGTGGDSSYGLDGEGGEGLNGIINSRGHSAIGSDSQPRAGGGNAIFPRGPYARVEYNPLIGYVTSFPGYPNTGTGAINGGGCGGATPTSAAGGSGVVFIEEFF